MWRLAGTGESGIGDDVRPRRAEVRIPAGQWRSSALPAVCRACSRLSACRHTKTVPRRAASKPDDKWLLVGGHNSGAMTWYIALSRAASRGRLRTGWPWRYRIPSKRAPMRSIARPACPSRGSARDRQRVARPERLEHVGEQQQLGFGVDPAALRCGCQPGAADLHLVGVGSPEPPLRVEVSSAAHDHPVINASLHERGRTAVRRVVDQPADVLRRLIVAVGHLRVPEAGPVTARRGRDLVDVVDPQRLEQHESTRQRNDGELGHEHILAHGRADRSVGFGGVPRGTVQRWPTRTPPSRARRPGRSTTYSTPTRSCPPPRSATTANRSRCSTTVSTVSGRSASVTTCC